MHKLHGNSKSARPKSLRLATVVYGGRLPLFTEVPRRLLPGNRASGITLSRKLKAAERRGAAEQPARGLGAPLHRGGPPLTSCPPQLRCCLFVPRFGRCTTNVVVRLSLAVGPRGEALGPVEHFYPPADPYSDPHVLHALDANGRSCRRGLRGSRSAL